MFIYLDNNNYNETPLEINLNSKKPVQDKWEISNKIIYQSNELNQDTNLLSNYKKILTNEEQKSFFSLNNNNKKKVVNLMETKTLDKLTNIKYKKNDNLHNKVMHKKKYHKNTDYSTKIFDWLYLGNYKNASDMHELRALNIKFILNCSLECINMFPNDFDYKKIPITVSFI